MGIVTIDMETAYSTDYSLSKISTIEYILDQRFETIGCAIQEGNGSCDWFVGHEAVAKRLSQIDWSKAAMLAHNCAFDGAIAAWRYGIVPKMYLDTVSMARALTHSVIGKSSLAAVSKYLGLPDKGTAVHDARGKWLKDFTPQELVAYGDYCVRDALNCRSIFNAFMRVFPTSELRLVDTIIRMFCEPSVKLDPHALATHLGRVRAEAAQIMNQVSHIDKSVFSSNNKFAELLQQHGVEPPRKISPTTGDETWALAKNDRAFKELCSDEAQPLAVQALLAARLNTKSTLEETRTQSLLKLSMLGWPEGREAGWAPVPIKYYGAHTGRMSGDGGLNFLNFKRGSPIRGAIVAPPGYRIVHRDSSQIECRMLAALAKCEKILTAFREGRDIYCEFATRIYGKKVTKLDVQMRFVGKTCILGLGYQTGAEKLRHTLFIGNGGISVPMELAETQRIVYTYRDTYSEIPGLWRLGDNTIQSMMMLAQPYAPGKHVRPTYMNTFPVVRAGANAIWLPNDMCISYPKLRYETTRNVNGTCQREIVYDLPYSGSTKLYGGKITENIDQALSRIGITDIIERVRAQTDYQPFLSTYDSVDYCVPEGQARDFDKLLEYEFAISPTWLPEVPLASEGGWGVNLLKAEKAENL
jgi:hypothetical protein